MTVDEPLAGLTVTLISQWYPPEPVTMPVQLCDALRAAGADVNVLTGVPNYPDGRILAGYHPWTMRRETTAGYPTFRVPLYPYHGASAVRRFANYSSFALSAAAFAQKTIRASDISVVYSSPATSALPAMVSHSLSGKPFVLVVQDLWPDTVLESNLFPSPRLLPVVRKGLEAFDKLSTRHAAGILVSSPGMQTALERRGVRADKIQIMYNWVSGSASETLESDGALRTRLGLDDHTLLFLYGGNIGEAQGLESWLTAIASLRSHESAHFAFVGSGIDRVRLENAARQLGLSNVSFLDPVTKDVFARYAADADAMIVSLRNSPVFEVTLPSKIQSCLSRGRAIVASVSGDAAKTLQTSGAALIAPPGNSDAIAGVILAAMAMGRYSLERMGDCGRVYYLHHMSQESGAEILCRAVLSALTPSE